LDLVERGCFGCLLPSASQRKEVIGKPRG
jgi:hypothetical protein